MNIGKLKKVPLREIWKNEGRDFTTWLENHIEHLEEVLEIKLSDIQREKTVGVFRVDLVAKDGKGNAVAIENQLEHTDHDHLGKLVTYLSNLGAKTAIWITSDPQPEHVKAIAWLNQAIDSSFYLVKVEALKIGESEPAPLFTVVEGPNNTGKRSGEQKRKFVERHKLCLEFWKRLLDLAKTENVLVHANRSSTADSWIAAPAGKSGLRFVYVVWSKEKTAVELYIDTRNKKTNKDIFRQLEKNKVQIERESGTKILWELLPNRRASRIRVFIKKGGLQDSRDKWDSIQMEMVKTMGRFYKALKPHIQLLRN